MNRVQEVPQKVPLSNFQADNAWTECSFVTVSPTKKPKLILRNGLTLDVKPIFKVILNQFVGDILLRTAHACVTSVRVQAKAHNSSRHFPLKVLQDGWRREERCGTSSICK